jgi:PKHD-type hydroxylase
MAFLNKVHCNIFYAKQSFFLKDETKDILLLKKETNESSIIFNNNSQGIQKNIRSSYTSWINLNNTPHLLNKINNLVDEVNNIHWRFKINYLGEASIVSYLDKNDNYGWHMDWNSDLNNCNRKISVIVQLSDSNDYKGCNLQIKTNKYNTYQFFTDIGSIIIFPSFLLHRATKLISGERHAMVLWYYGDSFT